MPSLLDYLCCGCCIWDRRQDIGDNGVDDGDVDDRDAVRNESAGYGTFVNDRPASEGSATRASAHTQARDRLLEGSQPIPIAAPRSPRIQALRSPGGAIEQLSTSADALSRSHPEQASVEPLGGSGPKPSHLTIKDRRAQSTVNLTELPKLQLPKSLMEFGHDPFKPEKHRVAIEQLTRDAGRLADSVLAVVDRIAKLIDARVAMPPVEMPDVSGSGRQTPGADSAHGGKSPLLTAHWQSPALSHADPCSPMSASPIVKSFGAVHRKLHQKSRPLGSTRLSVPQLKAMVRDMLRVQLVLPKIDAYSRSALTAINHFKSIEGMKLVKDKDTFEGANRPYRSFHVVFNYKDIHFEVQFHTEQTATARELAYPDYQLSRDLGDQIHRLRHILSEAPEVPESSEAQPDDAEDTPARLIPEIRREIQTLQQRRDDADARRIQHFSEVDIPPDLHLLRGLIDDQEPPLATSGAQAGSSSSGRGKATSTTPHAEERPGQPSIATLQEHPPFTESPSL